jgi:hypothetical protein
MRRLVVLAIVIAAAGCEDSPSVPAANPDPHIKAEQEVTGPFGFGGARRYEGPTSQAPDWAKAGPPPPQ